MQAAFIDFGSGKAFLPLTKFISYFKIPHNEKVIDRSKNQNEDIEDEKQTKKQFLSFYRKYKIQDVIKKDQVY